VTGGVLRHYAAVLRHYTDSATPDSHI